MSEMTMVSEMASCVGSHISGPLTIAEPRSLHSRGMDVPLCGNRSGWQSTGVRLPEGNVLVFIAELCRVGRLINHRRGRLTVVSTGPVPLGGEVVLILHTPSLQRVLGGG